MMIIKRKKNCDDSLSEQLVELSADYEALAKDQKERITALREQNMELEARIRKHEENQNAIVTTLLNAQKTAEEMLARAKEKARNIEREAEDRARYTEQSYMQHNERLNDLRERCNSILSAITTEMSQAERRKTPFYIIQKQSKSGDV